jgi:predicted enzyme related to lactoylglutathione lyase
VGERTSHAPGTFSWVDLATPDPGAAKVFYSGLFGWEAADMPGEAGTYTIFRLEGKDVAGCFAQPEGDGGAGSHWNSYVTVDDAEVVAARAAELGGAVVMPAADVEGIGRMAAIADPAGAGVALWESRGHIGAGVVNAPGALCWNDLATTDVDAAMEFHGELFGWTFHKRLDDDPLRYMRIHNAGTENGSIHQQGEDERGSPPHWETYFATSDLDATNSRAGELGGEVVVPPLEVPAGGRVSVVLDPQGAAFGLFDGPLDP